MSITITSDRCQMKSLNQPLLSEAAYSQKEYSLFYSYLLPHPLLHSQQLWRLGSCLEGFLQPKLKRHVNLGNSSKLWELVDMPWFYLIHVLLVKRSSFKTYIWGHSWWAKVNISFLLFPRVIPYFLTRYWQSGTYGLIYFTFIFLAHGSIKSIETK